MPPRDEQDYESRRQQIIDGALEVFSSKGFEEATNKDIARAAGIGSPGLIYHYFKDKADLFRQVLVERMPLLHLVNHGDDLMDLPPREALTIVARVYLESLTSASASKLLRLVIGEALRRPALAELFNRIGPAKGFGFLSRYFEHQMALGRLRRIDTGAAVRCFLGPLLAYVGTREIFPQADSQRLDVETMAATVVEVFLSGLETKG